MASPLFYAEKVSYFSATVNIHGLFSYLRLSLLSHSLSLSKKKYFEFIVERKFRILRSDKKTRILENGKTKKKKKKEKLKFFSTGHDRKKISAHATIYFPDHGHCLLLGVLLPFPGVHGGVGPAAVGVLPEVVEVDAVVLGAKWPMLQFLKIKQTTSSKMLRFF